MNDPRRLQDFERQTEDALPHCLRQIAETALEGVPRAVSARGADDRIDRLIAREALQGGAAGALARSWLRELHTAMQKAPANAEAAPENATTLTAALTLKDKQEIDEDIELARLVQDLESTCETALRELRALYSGLRGLREVSLDVLPLSPQRCAATLGQAVRSLSLQPGGRLLLLRVTVPAALKHLPAVFAADLRRLKEAQVQPADWRVHLRPASAAPDDPGADEEGAGLRIQSVLGRLMDRHEALGAPGDVPAGPISDAWMDGVVQAVLQEARPSPGMRRLMERLTEPGQRLAREEPQVWHQSEHVWWALLDRLLALCAVLDGQPGGAQDRFAERCDEIAAKLLAPGGLAPDSELCRTVLEQWTTEAHALAAQGSGAGEGPAKPVPAPGLFTLVREQMSQQLRTSEAPGTLRRFLMGPWLRVLAEALDPERGERAKAQRYTEWVDRVLASMRDGSSATDLDRLIEGGREGLQSIGLPEPQIATWMEDLHGRIEERRQAPPPAPAPPQWRHEDLPTVPIDLHPSAHGARARRDRIAWINGLRVGDVCRLHVEDRWYTVQLIVDPIAEGREDEVFVFQSRDPDARHALTKEALVLMRADGLATTVEPGAFIAKALNTLPATLDMRLPRRGRPR